MTTPQSWSVVVASFRGNDLLRDCLDSLRPQCAQTGAELVLSRSFADGEELPLRLRAGLELVRCASGSTLPVLRGRGLARAKGDWIALVEDHCVAEDGWLEALRAEATSEVQILGGSMGNAQRARGVDCGAFFAEYGFYGGGPAQRAGPPPITQANAAFHRSVVDVVSRWAQEGHWEDVIHGRLYDTGHQFRSVPGARMLQNQRYHLGSYSRDRFQHGRLYGSLRGERIPGWKRAGLLLGMPFLPTLLAVRILQSVDEEERHYLLKGLPTMLVFLTAWSFGEAIGYVVGRGAPR